MDRKRGQVDTVSLLSPLAFALQKLPWILVEDDGVKRSPAEHWHVPHEKLHKREWLFAHLQPLPVDMAKRLDHNSCLRTKMQALGLPCYDEEEKATDTRLLNALATAVEHNTFRHRSTFLGQVYSAWKNFPTDELDLPKCILVRRGVQNTLHVWNGEEATDEIYLPDDDQTIYRNITSFDRPVVIIEPKDAKRLSKKFSETFPEKVTPVSRLQLRPVTDNQFWEGKGENLLCNSEFKMLLPYLLAIAAFCGSQEQGRKLKNLPPWSKLSKVHTYISYSP